MDRNNTAEVEAVGAPTKLAYNGLRLIGADWLVLAICLAGSYWVSQQTSPIVGLLVALLVSCYLLWPLNNARRYLVWLMAVYGRVWIDWVREGVLWSDSPKEDVKFWRRQLMRLFVEPNVFMARVDQLGDYGIQYSRRLSTDSVAIEVDGWNFAGKEIDFQSEMMDRLAEDLKGFAYIKGLKPRVSFVARRRYQDASDQLAEQYVHSLPRVFRPNDFEDTAYSEIKRRGMELTTESAMQLYCQQVLTRDQVEDFNNFLIQRYDVLEAIRTYDRQHRTVVLLTIPQSASLKNARRLRRRKPVAHTEVERQDVIRLAERFRRSLAALGMSNPTILSKQELEDFRREGWDVDPESITAYREWRLDHPDEDRSQPEKSVTTDGVTITFDEKSHHATLRLTGLPASFMPETNEELLEFLSIDIKSYVTRSTVSEVVRGTREYVQTTAGFNLVSSFLDWFGAARFGPRAEKHEEKIRAQQEKLERDRNVNWFSIYLDLGHSNPRVIADDIRLIEEAVQALPGSCELITGSAWILKATSSANYGIAAM